MRIGVRVFDETCMGVPIGAYTFVCVNVCHPGTIKSWARVGGEGWCARCIS